MLQLELGIQPEEIQVTPGEVAFKIAMRPDRHPYDVIPAVEFIADLQVCDGLRLNTPGAPFTPIRLPSSATPAALASLKAFLSQLKSLQRVQDATGDEFSVPTLSATDQDMLFFADQLLTHGYVEWYRQGTELRVPIDRVHKVLATTPLIPRCNLAGTGDGTVPIAGHIVHLPGTISMDVTSAVVLNPAALERIVSQHHRRLRSNISGCRTARRCYSACTPHLS